MGVFDLFKGKKSRNLRDDELDIDTKTIKQRETRVRNARLKLLEEKLEYLRLQESFSSEDFEYVKTIASDEVISKTVMFEKYDGSGPRQLNSGEMNDLETVFVAISKMFGFIEESESNIFKAITKNEIYCRPRTLKMLQKILSKKDNSIEAEV